MAVRTRVCLRVRVSVYVCFGACVRACVRVLRVFLFTARNGERRVPRAQESVAIVRCDSSPAALSSGGDDGALPATAVWGAASRGARAAVPAPAPPAQAPAASWADVAGRGVHE